MTREEFIEVLEKKGYSYGIEGDKIVVTGGDKDGYVWLDSLKTIPSGVEFKNEWTVNLSSLKTIPPGVGFKNSGHVNLHSLKTISPGVVFKNGGESYLPSLIGGGFEDWPGNIEGIDSKRLLNLMIKKGMFI